MGSVLYSVWGNIPIIANHRDLITQSRLPNMLQVLHFDITSVVFNYFKMTLGQTVSGVRSSALGVNL